MSKNKNKKNKKNKKKQSQKINQDRLIINLEDIPNYIAESKNIKESETIAESEKETGIEEIANLTEKTEIDESGLEEIKVEEDEIKEDEIEEIVDLLKESIRYKEETEIKECDAYLENENLEKKIKEIDDVLEKINITLDTSLKKLDKINELYDEVESKRNFAHKCNCGEKAHGKDESDNIATQDESNKGEYQELLIPFNSKILNDEEWDEDTFDKYKYLWIFIIVVLAFIAFGIGYILPDLINNIGLF